MKGTRLTTFKNLLRFVILGDFSANKLKYILTIMGIALGIGIFVAVETAHDTIKQSFRQTRGYVPGRPDLQVSAGEFGFDEEIVRRIEAHPMVARTHPLLIVPATLKKGDREIPFQIYGADLLEAGDSKGSYALVLEEGAHYPDLLTDPESLILNEAFALENGWTLGTKIRVQYQDRIADFVLRGLMRSPPHVTGGNRYGVVDIAWAQMLFGRLGRLDRVDVTLRRHVDRLEAEREINRVLPPDITAFSPETSGMNMTGLVSSFQLNITALSLISLLVGMFLIYNTIFISYIRKRRQIGILRALGVTRKGIFWIFTTESLFYGVVGGFLGVWLGYALSYFTVDSMATTVNMLYTQVDASQVRLSPRNHDHGNGHGDRGGFSFFAGSGHGGGPNEPGRNPKNGILRNPLREDPPEAVCSRTPSFDDFGGSGASKACMGNPPLRLHGDHDHYVRHGFDYPISRGAFG